MISFLWNRGWLIEYDCYVEISTIRVKRFENMAECLILVSVLSFRIRICSRVLGIFKLNKGQDSLILVQLRLIQDLCWSSQLLIKSYCKSSIAIYFHFETYRFICFRTDYGNLFFLVKLKIIRFHFSFCLLILNILCFVFYILFFFNNLLNFVLLWSYLANLFVCTFQAESNLVFDWFCAPIRDREHAWKSLIHHVWIQKAKVYIQKNLFVFIVAFNCQVIG